MDAENRPVGTTDAGPAIDAVPLLAAPFCREPRANPRC
jgi:hypothetical protein